MVNRSMFRRFWHSEDATISMEAVLIMPLMLWGYFGLFILFEGYHALSSNVRSAYTISDLLSRETQAINADYIEGLNDIQDVLTKSPHRTVLRVTVVRYRESDDSYQLEWSYATAGKTALDQGDLSTEIEPYLPIMDDAQVAIVVETWMAFVPFLNITLKPFYDSTPSDPVFGPFYFESLVVTRPRFAGQLVWAG